MIIPGKLYLMEVHFMESRTLTSTSLTSCVDKISWNILQLHNVCTCNGICSKKPFVHT